MDWKSSPILEGIASKASRARNVFLAGIDDLPQPCQAAIGELYSRRVSMRGDAPLLGEYAPWLLADLLGVGDRDISDRLLSPWMDLYVHTLITDDLLDSLSQDVSPQVLIASSLIAQRGTRNLAFAFRDKPWVLLVFDDCFLEMAAAAIHEMQKHRNVLNSYTRQETVNIGTKFALLTACGAMMLSEETEAPPSPSALIPVSTLSSGMQFLDDITDWREDLRLGNYTPLLTGALEYIRDVSGSGDLSVQDASYEQVLGAMVVSGSLEKALCDSEALLASILTMDCCDQRRPGVAFLSLIRSEVTQFAEHVHTIRKRLAVDRTGCDFLHRDDLSMCEGANELLRSIERGIEIIAQGC